MVLWRNIKKYIITLNTTIREDFTEERRLHQRHEGSEKITVLVEGIPVRSNDKCKGPEAGPHHELEGQKRDGMTEAVHVGQSSRE